MRVLLAACLLSAALGLITSSSVGASQPPPDTSVNAMIAAAAKYLTDYKTQLAYLLADEEYTQQVFQKDGRPSARRVIKGELFVTFIPADRTWISVHDPAEVDGRPLEGREDLRQLLEREPLSGASRVLINRNARFNIGSITRNFNEPTLALLILEPERRARLKFDRKHVERGAAPGDPDVVTLGFKETDRPTLVHGVDGSPLFSSGELAIEAGTGRIRRTFIHFKSGPVVAELTTTYALEPTLQMWVPSVFAERYERANEPLERIECEATFTNYRKFEVRSRIR